MTVPEWTGARPASATDAIEVVRGRVEAVLASILAERRAELEAFDPAGADLADELGRLILAGGKRLRPAFLYWGHRAAGGPDGEPLFQAAAALELLHTFALVHDDVMDDAAERRGVATTRIAFAERADRSSDPGRFGLSVAVLVGDLALALAASTLRTSGFPADRLELAMDRFDRMLLEMAAGQYLDLEGAGRDASSAEHVAELKTGSYTIEGPVLIGAALAGASPRVEDALVAFARPAGEAFQLRDDLIDGEASPGVTWARVEVLVDAAVSALELPVLRAEPAAALRALVGLLRSPDGPM